MTHDSSVHILGSINIDQIVRVERLPRPGETVFGRAAGERLGGKGANQALAAARSGVRVRFVGAVGDDDRGRLAIERLRRGGVDVSSVTCTNTEATGMALVSVNESGENTVVVASGANACIRIEAHRYAVALRPYDVVVTQGEVPVAAIAELAQAAETTGARLVLNLAPVVTIEESVLRRADPLIVNEHEAEELGLVVEGEWQDIVRAAVGKRVRSLVITLGAQGAVYADGSSHGEVPATATEVVDTTGAGDAFTGALAASLARGERLRTAVEAGVAEAGRIVAVHGASPDSTGVSALSRIRA